MTALTETLRPGSVLARRYRVDHAIARGGYGIVYAGHQLDVDRPVVIKTLVPHVQIDESAIDRFEREARLVAGLRHPNTVTVFEFGSTDEGVFYLVMERIFGDPLSTVVRQQGALDPSLVRSILTQLLESLAEAHARGIIHRDLKPSNIMLCEIHGRRDFIKLLDFGIAKAIGGDDDHAHEPTLTGTGQFIGTPGYMAPEMIIGDPVDVRSDLYSVGLVGYELLTGQKAYQARSPLEKISVQATADPPPPPPHLAATPIWGVIEHLIQRSPAQRPQSAEDALAALHALDAVGTRPAQAIARGPATVLVSQPPAGFAAPSSGTGPRSGLDVWNVPPSGAAMRHEIPLSTPQLALPDAPPLRPSVRPWQLGLLAVALLVFLAGVVMLVVRMGSGEDADASDATAATPDAAARVTAAPIASARSQVPAAAVPEPSEPVAEPIFEPAIDTEPAQPEAPDPVDVVIVTDPPGATVQLDGEDVGQTPLDWSVLPDDSEAELVLVLDGYEDRTVRVSRASAGRYEFTLDRKRRRRPRDDDSARTSTTKKKDPEASANDGDDKRKPPRLGDMN